MLYCEKRFAISKNVNQVGIDLVFNMFTPSPIPNPQPLSYDMEHVNEFPNKITKKANKKTIKENWKTQPQNLHKENPT
jgi:hypothetical protein